MKHYLITGGAGFIGSNFIHYLINESTGVHITNLDALTYAGNLDNLNELVGNPRYTFLHSDICDETSLANLFTINQFDAVFHFAAESHVDRSIENPMAFVQTNVVGTANLLRACVDSWQKMESQQKIDFRFLHVSTDEVFGSLGPYDKPFSESTPYSPNSPYAASKAASDHLVRSYFHTYDFPTIVTNCSNNYGPYQFPEKLIPLIILNAKEGKPLPVYGDGGQIRDWLYVNDHCEAILEVLEKGKIGQTYNIGGNNQPTNLQVVQMICSILDELLPNSKFKPHAHLINFVKDRPGHDRRYAMDINKVNTEIGWQPEMVFEEGLRETIKWYLANQEWVNSIQEKPGYCDWIKTNYQKREEVSL
jgi:dTDP-glucose 4,6-dehydratase